MKSAFPPVRSCTSLARPSGSPRPRRSSRNSPTPSSPSRSSATSSAAPRMQSPWTSERRDSSPPSTSGARTSRPRGPRRRTPPQQRRQQVERGTVAPLEVLEDEHDRAPRRERLKRLHGLAQHPLARGAPDAALDLLEVVEVDQPRRLHEPRLRPLGERLHELLPVWAFGRPAEGIEHRQIRLARAAMLHALPVGEQGLLRERAGERGHQGALAGARLASHEHGPALSAQGAREPAAQHGHLRGAAGGGAAWVSSGPRSGGAPAAGGGGSSSSSWRRIARSRRAGGARARVRAARRVTGGSPGRWTGRQPGGHSGTARA